MPIARRYLITGRVQGVGFRYFVHGAAVREGLKGWVRNLSGGAVEALAEGEPEAIERFEAQLRQGPALARVDLNRYPTPSPQKLRDAIAQRLAPLPQAMVLNYLAQSVLGLERSY